MIPKTIHYCWFGGRPLDNLSRKCIKSWEKYCPEYQIVCWNESNFDVNQIPYIKEAYDAGRYGFVSDYARLDIIYKYGGIYLDTDVELIDSLNQFLNQSAFLAMETGSWVNTGLGFGAVPNHPEIERLRDVYSGLHFINDDKSYNLTPCPEYSTKLLLKEGFIQDNSKQLINEVTIYPCDVFAPKDYETGRLNVTNNTIAIHWYNASWMPKKQRLQLFIMRCVGSDRLNALINIYHSIRDLVKK